MTRKIMIRDKSSVSLGIKNVKCPNCRIYKMRLIEQVIFGMGNTKMINDTWWQCPDCVFTYTAEWFNKIGVYEEFVERIKGAKKIKFGTV